MISPWRLWDKLLSCQVGWIGWSLVLRRHVVTTIEDAQQSMWNLDCELVPPWIVGLSVLPLFFEFLLQEMEIAHYDDDHT
jgi:hypothetical protein